MGKAEAGSTKAIANAIKAKGLGRLRWYCQVCEKQCRDENGFQAHCRSEPHLRKMIALGPKAGAAIAEFSRQFQYEFITLLRTRHSTNRVQANAVYNEYIQDKHHVHMNATRWVTLSGFVQSIGKEGLVKVDEDDKGLWVQWIDNRPETLAKQAASLKKDRATMDGAERERKMLEDQIARARAQAAAAEPTTGLIKKEGEKISLSLIPTLSGSQPQSQPAEGSSTNVSSNANESSNATGSSCIPSTSTSTLSQSVSQPISFTLSAMPAKQLAVAQPSSNGNPLKRPASTNVFKAAKSAKTETSASSEERDQPRPKAFMSEAERLMREDQARKGKAPKGYVGAGPRRGGR